MTRKNKFSKKKSFELVSSYIDGVEMGHDRLGPDTHILSKVQCTHFTKRKSEVYELF